MPRFDRDDIELLAEHFFEMFLPRFVHQSDGSITKGTTIAISKKMTSKIGLAQLFENKITLSEPYFREHPHYLPYTMFHEMTHLWLYHSGFDPGHTQRFYKKMAEFRETGYLIDPEVHVHTRFAAEAKFIYTCSNCHNRWHMRDSIEHDIFCGRCWKLERERYFAQLTRVPHDSLDKGELDCA